MIEWLSFSVEIDLLRICLGRLLRLKDLRILGGGRQLCFLDECHLRIRLWIIRRKKDFWVNLGLLQIYRNCRNCKYQNQNQKYKIKWTEQNPSSNQHQCAEPKSPLTKNKAFYSPPQTTRKNSTPPINPSESPEPPTPQRTNTQSEPLKKTKKNAKANSKNAKPSPTWLKKPSSPNWTITTNPTTTSLLKSIYPGTSKNILQKSIILLSEKMRINLRLNLTSEKLVWLCSHRRLARRLRLGMKGCEIVVSWGVRLRRWRSRIKWNRWPSRI